MQMFHFQSEYRLEMAKSLLLDFVIRVEYYD